MNRRELRAKLLVGKYLVPLVVVLLVLAALGVYVTYFTHVEPGTEIEEFEESSWSSTASYTHEAEVLRPTTVFAGGEQLQNRQSYFERITPVLNGSLEYQYSATDSGVLQVETDHTLVMRSVDGDGFAYWSLEEPLASNEEGSVAPGETVRAPYTINVTAVREEVERVDGELGGTPGQTEILVESTVVVSGERNDRSVQEAYAYEKTIEAGGNVYSVESEGPFTESGEQMGQREVEATHGPLRMVGAPALVAVSLLGAIGLAVGRYRGTFDVSERERAWLAHASTHDEFEEWVSTGTVPDEAIPDNRVSVESLEGLVDLAIDSSRRVVQDPRRGQYLVLLDSVAYIYDIPDKAREPGPLAVAGAPDGIETSDEESPDEVDKEEATADEPAGGAHPGDAPAGGSSATDPDGTEPAEFDAEKGVGEDSQPGDDARARTDGSDASAEE